MRESANEVTAMWQDRYMTRFYDRASGWVDGTKEFHDLCIHHIPRGWKILEIGAGPSNQTSRFLKTLGELHGIDPDPDVLNNDALTSARVLENDRYAYGDGEFDVCVSDYVMEHVADPDAHLREVNRVLKPGGVYLFRTPNRFHYVAVVSSLTKHWFHKLVANRARDLPAGAHDPYPTVYAMNTRSAVRRIADAHGFEVAQLRMVEKEPSYGKFSRLAFLSFMAYERAVNASEAAADLRANIFCVLRKR